MDREKGAINQNEDRGIYKPGRRWASYRASGIRSPRAISMMESSQIGMQPDEQYVVSQVVANGVTNGTEKPAFCAWLRMALMVS
ncbi:hypothetical protein PG984_013748 [Apiospora sp. TS-2023a]